MHRLFYRGLRAACASSLLLLAGSCSGSIGAPGLLGEGAQQGSDTETMGQTVDFRAAPSALRKLTVHQYQNTVNDLVGAQVTLPELEADSSINGFFAIGAAKTTISPAGVEKFEQAAFAVADRALGAANRDAVVGCAPSGATDAACTRAFLQSFGGRAFRRPLSDDELERYAALAREAQAALGDFHEGLKFAIAGLLQSPSFLFRVELGHPGQGSQLPFDDYELATRLSYLLWNTTPDDALLAAAARGELSETRGLEAQTERLLADPRTKSALDNFHSERLALDEIALVEKDPSVMASGWDDSLKDAMRDDVLRTIEDYTFGVNGDFRELFTTKVAFVNAGLAALYGVPGTGRVTLPSAAPRAGLLGKAAFLATYAHTDGTSPTKRGKFIRERLLCQSIPAPPPDVNTVLPEPAANATTMRERLEVHTEIASCAACHKLMDPLGLSLEHFDSVGRYRADDRGHALDVTGSLNGTDYEGALGLAQLLHDVPDTSECVARQLYRYATAHVETDGEEPALKAIIEAFGESGYAFTALLRAVIASDGFRYGGAP
jgi:hypothetical protein